MSIVIIIDLEVQDFVCEVGINIADSSLTTNMKLIVVSLRPGKKKLHEYSFVYYGSIMLLIQAAEETGIKIKKEVIITTS